MDMIRDSFPLQVGAGAFVCMGFHALRLLTDGFFTKLAAKFGAKSETECQKFGMQALNFMFHLAAGAFAAMVVRNEGWLRHPELVWAGNYREIPSLYVAFYCVEFGYHLQRLVALFFKERKKDFTEMLIHHVVTIALIATSFAKGYTRIGIMVMMVHDTSDILGCLAKMANAVNQKQLLIGIFFPMFMTWFYTRLWILPMHIVPISAHHHSSGVEGTATRFCTICLCILVVLHAYWFSLFMRMLHRVVVSKGKVAEDIQEDSKSKHSSREVKGSDPFTSPPCMGPTP